MANPYVTVTDGYVDPSGAWVPYAAQPTPEQVGNSPFAPKAPSAPGGYYTSNDGYTVQTAYPRTPAGPDMPSTPLSVPLPPQRPTAPLPPVRPSGLQAYQAATQPSTFGSNVPLPPPRPQEDGPPMPTADQMAQMQAPQAPQQPMGLPGNSPYSDPSSAQNFWRQQMAPTEGTLSNASGSGLMSLFHNLGGSNPAQGNGAGKGFQWVRPDSIVGKLMSLMGDQSQGKPVDYSDGPLGRIIQSMRS